jgi:hypothetical protein
MATTTSLSTSPLELSRQIEWCSLFLEHLDELATLAWYLAADAKLAESIILRTLKSLDSIPFDTSQPVLTFKQARDMLITQGIAALNPGHDGPRGSERLPLREPLDLQRLAFRMGQRLLFSMGGERHEA